MEEFKGYIVEGQEETQQDQSEQIEERNEFGIGRPKLLKFYIKQNNKKWSVKREDTGKIYYIKKIDGDPVMNMHEFLSAIKAYNNSGKMKTAERVDYMKMATDIIKNGKIEVWVPETYEDMIKNTWSYSKQELEEAKLLDTQSYQSNDSSNISLEDNVFSLSSEMHKYYEIDPRVDMEKYGESLNDYIKKEISVKVKRMHDKFVSEVTGYVIDSIQKFENNAIREEK